MNVVLITSVIKNAILSPYLNEEERLEQTRVSINTVKSKIPNAYIVIIEGSPLDDDLYNKFIDFGANEVFYASVEGLGKSAGELTLLCSYLSSDNFKKISNDCESLSKLSGRYYLTDDFDFSDEYIIYSIDKSWSGRGACSTRYWKVQKDYIPTVINKLETIKNNIGYFVDIEHAFYYYDTIPQSKIKKDKLVGVAGIVSPFGKLENA